MAQKIIQRVDARYEAREVPFGKIYEWHPTCVAIECDCGERLILTAASTTTACSCGARLGGFVHSLREREDRLPDEIIHPWLHDAKERAQQHRQDEAAYPEESPWRYDDVTADNG